MSNDMWIGMHQVCRVFFVLLAFFPCYSSGVIPEIPPFRAVLLESGIFRIDGPVTDEPAANTAAGRISEHEGARLLEATDRVKAKLGMSFGIRYRLDGVKDGEVTDLQMRTLHPPMQGPSGKPQTRSTASTVVDGAGGVAEGDVIYTLSEPFEVLPGRWTFQLLYKGSVILSKDFTVE
jgi:hypothetical protein